MFVRNALERLMEGQARHDERLQALHEMVGGNRGLLARMDRLEHLRSRIYGFVAGCCFLTAAITRFLTMFFEGKR